MKFCLKSVLSIALLAAFVAYFDGGATSVFGQDAPNAEAPAANPEPELFAEELKMIFENTVVGTDGMMKTLRFDEE